MMKNRYDFFSEIIENNKDQQFIQIDASKFITYSEFLDRAIRLLNYLVKQGVRYGDRVVVCLENRHEYLELIMALGLGGVVICPVDPSVNIGQLDKIKFLTKATMVINSYDQLAYSFDSTVPGCVYQGGVADPFLIVFSSGTTGAPKGVVQTLENFFGSAIAFAKCADFLPGKLTLHNWPMFYNAGLFNLFACPLVSGGRIKIGTRFSAKSIENFWNDVINFKPDYIYLSPTMASSLTKTFNFFKFDADLLKEVKVISTGSILYPSIKNEFLKKFGASLLPCFGVTELGGSFTIGSSESTSFSVGTVVDAVTVKVCSISDSELLVSSPYMALGYLNDCGGLDLFDRSVPFHTGDLARLENGELFISGRKKDSIKKGGELINLSEIEDLILSENLCDECLAVGRLDVFWGEVYDVFFIPKQNLRSNEVKDALIRLLNCNLSQIQRPSLISEVADIPKTSSGKPIKRLISYENIDADQFRN
ncbi:class I adenylate-forming enzyme family protein [Deefgea piscis]|uniref:class I adenylate-forming enzyme family protein n=1 Tax=Deefgea piscis TaxID=2739061 RepID=UPI001C8145A0|nr:class I adenylate-forming enzyme family protein [Deefgea piscis]QZA80038.1 acyl--CoA ligase [Deefgea piscis]